MRQKERPSKPDTTKEQLIRIIESSATARQAWETLTISQYAFYRLRKKFGIGPVQAWSRHGVENLLRFLPVVPDPVIMKESDRRFVATMIGTEGCITCSYDKRMRTTHLVIVLEMTDRPWVVEFAKAVGLGPPSEQGRAGRVGQKRKFRKAPSGIRALRVLKEVRPHLFGARLREAERAIEFFSPSGHVKGRFLAADIWGDLR